MLHADVVGSTGLVQKDERVAHERIREAFQRLSAIVESYSGVTREVRGDALIAEFQRASDAVSAALGFQSSHAKLTAQISDGICPEIRIGIAIGEVIISDDTVTGAGIVLAQRLEQLAAPGAVCISAAIKEALPARLPFEYRPLGEQIAKGFDEPVLAFLVSAEDHSIPEPEPKGDQESFDRRKIAVVGILMALIGALGFWFYPREM